MEQIKEQGIDAGNLATISATELANYFKGYVESKEDVAALLSGIINKLDVDIGFDEKYWFVSEVYSEICKYKIQKEKCQER